MIHKILVNKNTCHYHSPFMEKEAKRGMLEYHIKYFKEVLKYRGYLYMNQIYETIGVAWTDLRNNHVICCYDSIDSVFTIEDDAEHDGFIVTVNYNYY